MQCSKRQALIWSLAAGVAAVIGIYGMRMEIVDVAGAQVVLDTAQVELTDVGRLPGTDLIYVEFADGGRCLASSNGTGALDCDW